MNQDNIELCLATPNNKSQHNIIKLSTNSKVEIFPDHLRLPWQFQFRKCVAWNTWIHAILTKTWALIILHDPQIASCTSWPQSLASLSSHPLPARTSAHLASSAPNEPSRPMLCGWSHITTSQRHSSFFLNVLQGNYCPSTAANRSEIYLLQYYAIF